MIRHAISEKMAPEPHQTVCGMLLFASAANGGLYDEDGDSVDLVTDASPVTNCERCRSALLLGLEVAQ